MCIITPPELFRRPGALIFTKDKILLRVGDNKATALIDVEAGTSFPGPVGPNAFFYSHWKIMCPGLDEHEFICDFKMIQK
jgi:hypothetical protein